MLNEPEKTSHIIFFFSLNVNRLRQILFFFTLSLSLFLNFQQLSYTTFRIKKKIVSQLVKSMSHRTNIKKNVLYIYIYLDACERLKGTFIYWIDGGKRILEILLTRRLVRVCISGAHQCASYVKIVCTYLEQKGKILLDIINFLYVKTYPSAKLLTMDRYFLFRNWEIMLHSDLLL